MAELPGYAVVESLNENEKDEKKDEKKKNEKKKGNETI